MEDDTKTTISQLKDILTKFSRERLWEKNYKPVHLAKAVVIEAGELLEEFQWVDGEQSEELVQNFEKKMKIAFELVDVMYYLFMLAEAIHIDICLCTEAKLKELQIRYPKKI